MDKQKLITAKANLSRKRNQFYKFWKKYKHTKQEVEWCDKEVAKIQDEINEMEKKQ